jgi:hypothetical protein
VRQRPRLNDLGGEALLSPKELLAELDALL